MKRILLKTFYSLFMSFIIFNTITIIKGYFQPFRTIVALTLVHFIVLLIGLLELGFKTKQKLRIIPHIILALLFLLWTLVSPSSNDGNDFYMIPLTTAIAQLILIVFEIKKIIKIKND